MSKTLSKDKAKFILDKNDAMHNNFINILPICFLKGLKLRADLFISTWVLSESSKFSQNYVASNRWFGAENILIAYQKNDIHFAHANRVGDMAKRDKAVMLSDSA